MTPHVSPTDSGSFYIKLLVFKSKVNNVPIHIFLNIAWYGYASTYFWVIAEKGMQFYEIIRSDIRSLLIEGAMDILKSLLKLFNIRIIELRIDWQF